MATRFAIIGAAAGIATTHLQALALLPDAQIVGMADLARERGAERAAAAGCPFFADHRAMLDAVRPDVAVICTPHPTHAALAIDALAAGAHVLVEKPVAIAAHEADAIIAAAAAANRVVAVNFQQRFRPVVARARALIDAGDLGDLVRVLCVEPWFRTQAYYDSAGWRGTWRGEGGGVLMNQGPHTLDLLCYLAGMPQLVWGWTKTRGHTMECEDTAQAMLEYPNGAPGYLYLSTAEAGRQQRLEIVGDRAAIELIGDTLAITRYTPAQSSYRATSPEMWGAPRMEREVLTFDEPHGGHLAVYTDLLHAIATGARPRADARAGCDALELANAVILSGATNTPVTLPLDRAAYCALLIQKQGQ